MPKTHSGLSEARISFTMSNEDFERLKRMARSRSLNVSPFIRMVLREYLDAYAGKEGKNESEERAA